MRDLRSPVFLHIDGGGILINLMFWQSSPNLCVKYFFPGTSCAGDANASMSVHYHP